MRQCGSVGDGMGELICHTIVDAAHSILVERCVLGQPVLILGSNLTRVVLKGNVPVIIVGSDVGRGLALRVYKI